MTWTSSDGVDWREGRIDGEAFPDPDLVAESRGTFLVLGKSDGQLTAWTSTDGDSWSRRVSRGLPGLGGDGVIEFLGLSGGPLGLILLPNVDSASMGMWFSEGL